MAVEIKSLKRVYHPDPTRLRFQPTVDIHGLIIQLSPVQCIRDFSDPETDMAVIRIKTLVRAKQMEKQLDVLMRLPRPNQEALNRMYITRQKRIKRWTEKVCSKPLQSNFMDT